MRMSVHVVWGMYISSFLEPPCGLYIDLYLGITLIILVCNYLPVCHSVLQGQEPRLFMACPSHLTNLLSTDYVPGCFWALDSEQNFIKLCSPGAYILVGETDNIQINKLYVR